MGRERLANVRQLGPEGELMRMVEKIALEVVVLQRYLGLGETFVDLDQKSKERIKAACLHINDYAGVTLEITNAIE